MKRCGKCGRCLPSADFNASAATRDRLQSWCKPCQRASKRKWSAIRKQQHTENTERPDSKTCSACKTHLPRGQFYINLSTRDGLDDRCVTCVSQRHRSLKQRFVDGYGGRCTCCGEARIEFLTMEHRRKDGLQHRRQRDVVGTWRDAIKQGFPSHYTVLCYNCNLAETHGRVCPHKTNATDARFASAPLWQAGII